MALASKLRKLINAFTYASQFLFKMSGLNWTFIHLQSFKISNYITTFLFSNAKISYHTIPVIMHQLDQSLEQFAKNFAN